MIDHITAEVFHTFIYGAVASIGGGLIFEGGKRYVKTGFSTQFKGKLEALPFFFSVLIFGRGLQELDPVINELVHSVPPVTRLGIMAVGGMALFNYSVDYFNYLDHKSIAVYFVGLILGLWPYL
jgi:hypothetical protein